MNSPREYFFQMPDEYGLLAGTVDPNYMKMCENTRHVSGLDLQLEVGSFTYDNISTGNNSRKTMLRIIEIYVESLEMVNEFNLILPHHGRAIEPAVFVLKWSLELLPTQMKEKIAMHYAWGQSVTVNGYLLEPNSFKEVLTKFKLIGELASNKSQQDDDEFTQWGAAGAYKY